MYRSSGDGPEPGMNPLFADRVGLLVRVERDGVVEYANPMIIKPYVMM